jgi:hypothetical protein
MDGSGFVSVERVLRAMVRFFLVVVNISEVYLVFSECVYVHLSNQLDLSLGTEVAMDSGLNLKKMLNHILDFVCR